MAQTTYYPNAHPETTSVDGHIYNDGVADFGTCRGAATGSTVSDTDNVGRITVGKNSGGNFNIRRGFFLFDTSSIPTSATITSATFGIYATNVWDNDNDAQGYLVVVASTPASNTALSTADFDQVADTALSDTLDCTSLSAAAYNTFTLNATGLAAITKAGITKFAIREGHDVTNNAYAGANDTDNGIQFQSAENTNKPKLTITYSVPGGSLFFAQL